VGWKLTEHARAEAIERVARGESQATVAADLGVSHSAVNKLVLEARRAAADPRPAHVRLSERTLLNRVERLRSQARGLRQTVRYCGSDSTDWRLDLALREAEQLAESLAAAVDAPDWDDAEEGDSHE
jgi:hypothetical protein